MELNNRVSEQWNACSKEERQVFMDYYKTVELPNHLQSKNFANPDELDDTKKSDNNEQHLKRGNLFNDQHSPKKKKQMKSGLHAENESERLDSSIISDEDSTRDLYQQALNENHKSNALQDRSMHLNPNYDDGNFPKHYDLKNRVQVEKKSQNMNLSLANETDFVGGDDKHLKTVDSNLQNNADDIVTTTPASTATAAAATISPLLQFLLENEDCLKNCTAYAYYEWLQSEDVDSIQDFAEAIQDDDFAVKMKQRGIKGFKMHFIQKACSKT